MTYQASFDILSSMSDNTPKLGTYLKGLREAKKLTLRAAEEKTGISNAFLSQLESGKVRQPSPVMLYKLASLYEVPYEYLMERAGYPVPQPAASGMQSDRSTLHRLGNITPDEEDALLEYLSFLRGRRGKLR